jgi:hypothetical protein
MGMGRKYQNMGQAFSDKTPCDALPSYLKLTKKATSNTHSNHVTYTISSLDILRYLTVQCIPNTKRPRMYDA